MALTICYLILWQFGSAEMHAISLNIKKSLQVSFDF